MGGHAGALHEMCPLRLRALPDSEKLVLGSGTDPSQRKVLLRAAGYGAARPHLEAVATEVRVGLSTPTQGWGLTSLFSSSPSLPTPNPCYESSQWFTE